MTKTQESNTSNPMATGNIPKLLAQLANPGSDCSDHPVPAEHHVQRSQWEKMTMISQSVQ